MISGRRSDLNWPNQMRRFISRRSHDLSYCFNTRPAVHSDNQRHFFARNCSGKSYRELIVSMSVQTANRMRGVKLGTTRTAGVCKVNRDTRHTVLVSLVACAVGGTASAAVILGLVDFTMTQASMPPISPRAIVWKASAQNSPLVEPSTRLAAISVVSPADKPVVQNSPTVEAPTPVAMVSPSNEPVTQTRAEHPSKVHSQQLRKHTGREHHWRRRFAHTSSTRFGLW